MRTKRTPPPGEMMLTTQEAAQHLGVSPSFLNKKRAKRQGPVAHVYDRAVFYRLSDLEAYAAAHRVEPIEEFVPLANANGGGRS